MPTIDPRLVDLVRGAAILLSGADHEYDPLLDLIGDARFVLIGEASHGTDEFYRERARISRRLIVEKGFAAVVAEADWPDAYRVNCYVNGRGSDHSADEALDGFRRWPTWMWRNTVVQEFVEWLRTHNASLPASRLGAGFYGMDLYSLHGSIEAVVRYLDRVDPAAAQRARDRYSCFEMFGQDTQAYGLAASFNTAESCEQEVVNQLLELQRNAAAYARLDGRIAEDDAFFAEQNARLAVNAEEYYRQMFRGRVSSWNLRDCHMAETIDALVGHLGRWHQPAKLIVWAHNSHLGDARATEMGAHGELNVGRLVRERAGRDAILVGFSTSTGTVTAATDWGGPIERKQVSRPLPGSYEEVFHETGLSRFLLRLRASPVGVALREPRLERAIGVIYRPETERYSHYFNARLSDQFDALIHIDRTIALQPLDRAPTEPTLEAPETYPSSV
ncbi:MAG: erythromycin esterase family protein [Chloroflexi bacterium]|nr:erythromycin esterase family protein [Chloroflexota bacterium]